MARLTTAPPPAPIGKQFDLAAASGAARILTPAHPKTPFFVISTHYNRIMNFLVSSSFRETASVLIELADKDPNGFIHVFRAVLDDGVNQSEEVYFEASPQMELWEILNLCLDAFKEFKSESE